MAHLVWIGNCGGNVRTPLVLLLVVGAEDFQNSTVCTFISCEIGVVVAAIADMVAQVQVQGNTALSKCILQFPK